MKSLQLTAAVLTVAMVVPAAHAQEALAELQGRWLVTGAEHAGKPFDAIKGGVMTISGRSFEIRTASGNVLKGTLVVDMSKRPSHMDMLHADGVRWEAIYALEGASLRLNYVEAGGKDPRPTTFATSAKTEESLVILERETR